ncbi:hypothetical protein KIN20_016521 [Parelaphostrongylus tenuis]|uniref:Uncharacterized protein n=1 Tax=Parelaphostrongylus tenuis TaxID=148309 RepID=A0AAD5N5D3_PARTN|nr:hypothetical protein KIN20_016521 [Parelaphostrongylus tenuis]
MERRSTSYKCAAGDDNKNIQKTQLLLFGWQEVSWSQTSLTPPRQVDRTDIAYDRKGGRALDVLHYSREQDSDDDFYTKNTDMKKIRTTVTNRDDLPEVTYNRQSIGEAKPDTAVFHYDDDSDSLDLSGPEPEPESLFREDQKKAGKRRLKRMEQKKPLGEIYFNCVVFRNK